MGSTAWGLGVGQEARFSNYTGQKEPSFPVGVPRRRCGSPKIFIRRGTGSQSPSQGQPSSGVRSLKCSLRAMPAGPTTSLHPTPNLGLLAACAPQAGSPHTLRAATPLGREEGPTMLGVVSRKPYLPPSLPR